MLQAAPLQSKRTILLIDEKRLCYNFNKLVKRNHGRPLLPVVKANAYGHGVEIVATLLAKSIADKKLHGFAVATIDEAIEIDRLKLDKPIHILSETSFFCESVYKKCQQHKFIATIGSLTALKQLARYFDNKQKLNIDLKLNTGMNRLGLDRQDFDEAIRLLKRHPNIIVNGILTHLYAGKMIKNATKQAKEFRTALGIFQENGICPRYTHMVNSEGLRSDVYPEGDFARVGLHLYGVGDSELKPILRWDASLLNVRYVAKDEGIGYGPVFRAPKNMKVAILAVGYADGYFRNLANKAHVIIHGKRCRVVGAVSMDMIAVDVSHVSKINDKTRATLIGKNGLIEVRAEDLAKIANTISWDVLSRISARVPRIRK